MHSRWIAEASCFLRTVKTWIWQPVVEVSDAGGNVVTTDNGGASVSAVLLNGDSWLLQVKRMGMVTTQLLT